MFPRVGSQILIGPGPPEDFHVMEVKNLSRQGLNVARFGAGARMESDYSIISIGSLEIIGFEIWPAA